MKLNKYILILTSLTIATAAFAVNPNDLDGDKQISWEEFKTLHEKRAANQGGDFDERRVKYLFEDKDRDGDGVLSYKEFGSHPVDLDGDKAISYEEFVLMMKKREKRWGREIKQEWIDKTYAKKDLDGDGTLSYQELAKPLK